MKHIRQCLIDYPQGQLVQTIGGTIVGAVLRGK